MRIENIHYPKVDSLMLSEQLDDIQRYLRLAAEYGCTQEAEELFFVMKQGMDTTVKGLEQLVKRQTDPDEPDGLEEIRRLRPAGPRIISDSLPVDYPDRIRGAFCGRLVGCTLGAALEFQSVSAMEDWAACFEKSYPLQNYWSYVKEPGQSHYITGKKKELTRAYMNAAPPDDDTMYTLLGLLLMEQYGFDFTQENIADIWMRYLPLGKDEAQDLGQRGCWWGERSMLKNLHAGFPIQEAGIRENPNLQNIAAWTRADSYGYVCPGRPEMAAALAWRDASINHRRNGVYGSMFMAATIAAAFVTDSPLEAVKIGLTEIPKNCLFSEAVSWALKQNYKNYREASDAVWCIYKGMFNGSALTNALHVIMGLQIGEGDFTKTIGETVAMGGDNDCTGATAGSILGAVIGKEKIPSHWLKPFRGRMQLYLMEHPRYLEIESVCQRFETLAAKNRNQKRLKDRYGNSV